LISAGISDRASTGSIWAAGGVVGSHITCNATTFSFTGYDIRTAAFLPFTGVAAVAVVVFGEQLSCRDSCRASLKDDMMRWVLMFLMFYPYFAQSLWSFRLRSANTKILSRGPKVDLTNSTGLRKILYRIIG
jgi:hypothetical protein